MESNNQIQLVQQPIIKHALVQVGADVTKRIEDLNIPNLIASDDTIKLLKSIRADLNKELDNYEAQRKMVKEAVMAPYNEFEGVYKEQISDKIKEAVEMLKTKISQVEQKVISDKAQKIRDYFGQVSAEAGIDFVPFERTGIVINLSTTEKKYRDTCDAIIKEAKEAVALINSLDYPVETLVEYKKILNATQAIMNVKARKAAEAEAMAKATPAPQPEKQPEPIPEPQPQAQQPQAPAASIPAPDPSAKIFVAKIQISGTAEQLKAVSEFLKLNNITYTNL